MRYSLQVASSVLLLLQCFKERFEIAFAETLRALALNDFEKESRPVFHRLGKDLEQIALFIPVDQDAQPLQGFEVFVDMAYSIQHRGVIARWYVQEFHAALLQVGH